MKVIGSAAAMDKKIEIAILKMVYDNNRIDEIIPGENPDFKVRNKQQQNFFGVEITELYYSESNARLDNIQGYLGEILDAKRFRHRKDKRNLPVREFTLKSNGKPDQQFEGIIQELPSVSDYVQMVVDVINKKGARIQDYIQGLTHVNLIIHDTGRRLITLTRSDFYKIFFTPSLRATLRDSNFREIFFITTLEKKADRRIYIPLKMLLLVSQLYMFDGVLQHYYHHLNVGSPKKELSLFACYLYHIGTKEIYISDTAEEFELICGNYGVIMTDQKELTVRDYGDYSLSESAVPFTNKGEGMFIDDAFEKNVSEFVHNNTFAGDFVFDINNPV